LYEEIKSKKFLKAASILLTAFFFMAAKKPSTGNVSLQRIIHEAENLSLNKDRLLACGVLWRNAKKANRDDAKTLKEKLFQLSRYYYTDKGFQAFLAGKDAFQKQKYQDALDKFLEADDLEAGNVEVLHYLTLTQLWLKKTSQAEATNKRAVQMCPIDIEIQKDVLGVQLAEELWTEEAATGASLVKESGDASAQTFQGWGIALLKTDLKNEAKKVLEQAVQKDPRLPETYYWLAYAKDEPEAVKLLTKYVELCKNRISPQGQAQVSAPQSEREFNFCSHLGEAEKKSGTVP
jgi:tetratricopeptide (TPR) repeat protein